MSAPEVKTWVSPMERGVLASVGSSETSKKACQGGNTASQGLGSADAYPHRGRKGALLNRQNYDSIITNRGNLFTGTVVTFLHVRTWTFTLNHVRNPFQYFQ